MKTLETPFIEQIAKNISAKITELKKDGTTGMSLLNLLMVTKTPSQYLDGAPAGPAGYKVIFRDVALSKPITRRFLINTNY